MELQQERPPDYVQRSPETVEWPAIPQHAPEHPRPSSDITLPDLKTVLSSDFEQMSPRQPSVTSPVNSVRSLPRMDPGPEYNHAVQDHRRGLDTIMAGANETDSVMSYEDTNARTGSRALSVEDPDVRMAAEALSGLGNPTQFTRGHDKIHVHSHASEARASDGSGNPEPLLELVSAAHPWVGGTMKGSLTAYETAKYYSPRIVRYGVNFAERNIGTPVVSAVGSVSQITGVEAGLRRYLDARRPNDIERGDKNMDSSMDVDEVACNRPREGSIPPPYGASRPPSYREEASPHRSRELAVQERPSANRSWSSQLFVSTSGLSVALSTTSRKSLRMCLSFLSAQAGYLEHVSKALSLALSNYEQRRQEYRNNSDSALEKGQRASTPDHDESARRLAEEIRQHCDAIWKTLQHAVTTVSSYTGAALPQNAREFVRLQLMSLPQRWRIVANTTQADSETSRTAQRMIDFSSEGLDMMSQVAGVLKATLDSAEGWLAAVGRRDQQAEDQQMQDASANESQTEREKS
ncbi:hypothetical protein PRZ48_007661 [Zasmidium cellare]|uniref:Opi1-domain-containing protein n=1 Tax=Zasmidium cellare TaxID=395010 RepID=A0ABR0EK49_ZASCE|nr:hypothetical protein PRZ48_007661 [Zasmidium cellare]